MVYLRIFMQVFLIMFTLSVESGETEANHINTVERFVAAFNAHDSSAMAALATNDIEWLSIAGERVNAEAKGKGDLVNSMNAYFKSCPTCRSELSGVTSTASRVSAIETASWQGKNGLRSQTAISVYEFSGNLISRVYYFPAEK